MRARVGANCASWRQLRELAPTAGALLKSDGSDGPDWRER